MLDAQRRSMIDRDGSALLCVEFYGDRADDLSARMDALERDLEGSRRRCRTAARCSIPPAQQRDLELPRSGARPVDGDEGRRQGDLVRRGHRGRAREAARLHRPLPPHRQAPRHDRRRLRARLGRLPARAAGGQPEDRRRASRKFEAIANEVADLVLEFGGALSGEHGDGLVRSAFNEKMFGSELYQAFREVKRTFDPHGLFNPGRIVDTPPLTSHLRFGAGYATPSPVTFFDFSDDGGFGRAVEMCSGVGLCRKKREGTMCPSYMATQGRGALDARPRQRAAARDDRAAGRSRSSSDQGVHEVLDLCLECRACKSECPVGVDMAQVQERVSRRLLGSPRPVGQRARVFGNARIGRGMGQPLRAALECDCRQRAPRSGWPRRPSASIAAGRCRNGRGTRCASRSPDGNRRSADRARRVLFADTFTELRGSGDRPRRDRGARTRPALRRTAGAERLLRAAADLAGTAAGGTPLAAANVHALYDAAGRGTGDRVRRAELPVGGPRGCAGPAARRTAAPSARGRRARRCCSRSISKREWRARPRHAARSKPARRSVLLHPHCHQRSMGLAAPAKALLSRIPVGARSSISTPAAAAWPARSATRAITTTCRERLPSASCCRRRARWTNDSILVAGGTSCRHQVDDLAGVRAVHPAVLLRSLWQVASADGWRPDEPGLDFARRAADRDHAQHADAASTSASSRSRWRGSSACTRRHAARTR